MGDLIDALKSVADIIIFDSPPALAVTDSAVLARQLDGVLLVVDSGETREPLARRAAEELGKVGAHILGCLLYTSDAADERSSVGLGGRRITKKKKTNRNTVQGTTYYSRAI